MQVLQIRSQKQLISVKHSKSHRESSYPVSQNTAADMNHSDTEYLLLLSKPWSFDNKQNGFTYLEILYPYPSISINFSFIIWLMLQMQK